MTFGSLAALEAGQCAPLHTASYTPSDAADTAVPSLSSLPTPVQSQNKDKVACILEWSLHEKLMLSMFQTSQCSILKQCTFCLFIKENHYYVNLGEFKLGHNEFFWTMFCYILLKLYLKKLPFRSDVSLSERVCKSSSPHSMGQWMDTLAWWQ